jgi:hypothetical protein
MASAGIAVALVVLIGAGLVVLVALTRLAARLRRPDARNDLEYWVGRQSRAREPAPLPWTAMVVLTFVAGTGAVSLQMLLYSVAGLRFGVGTIAIPWLGALIAIAGLPHARRTAVAMVSAPASVSRSSRQNSIALCLTALIALQIAYAMFFALSFSIRGWDSWEFWFMKARILFTHRALTPDFPPGPSFADYPLHMPLAVSWLYAAAGSVQDRAAKVLYVLQFAGLLIAFNGLVRSMTSRMHALFFTALLSSVPVLVIQGAGLPPGVDGFGLYEWDQVGYSDLTLSLCFLLAGGLVCVAFETKHAVCLYWAAFFCGVGAWTKNEGLVFACLGASAMVWAARRRIVFGRELIALAAIILVFILPWSLYKSLLHVSSDYMRDTRARMNVGAFRNVPIVLSGLGSRFLKATGPINLWFYLYASTVILNRRRLRSSPALVVDFLVVSQLMVYLCVFVMSPQEIRWSVSTTMSRVILHVAPLGLLAAAVHAFEWGTPGGGWREDQVAAAE